MIYFDNAATTFPKPRSVYAAAENAMRVYGGNPGRSSHRLSREASRLIYECREEVAELFGGRPENVVFTQNATYALNMAISALRKKSGTALISSFEHNAVLRPIAAGGRYEVFDGGGAQEEIVSSFARKLENRPCLAVCNHVSNLCGAVLPIGNIGSICQKRGIPFVVDASQSAGRARITFADSNADAICAPGHKGLYGIQGCGFVIFSDKHTESASALTPYVFGGNGVNSLESTMPDFLPERFEAGTLSTPSIASLCAGIKEVKRIGVDEIEHREGRLGKRLLEGLSVICDMELYGDAYGGGTVLFNMKGVPSERLAQRLDESGICVRAGYHCCPLGHITLKTPEGGAVRASFSIFNTEREVDRLLMCLTILSREQK